MADWAFIPNPVEVFSTSNFPNSSRETAFLHADHRLRGSNAHSGKYVITTSDNLSNIDLFKLGVHPGIYFVRVESNGPSYNNSGFSKNSHLLFSGFLKHLFSQVCVHNTNYNLYLRY
jgi:hypothetical protein